MFSPAVGIRCAMWRICSLESFRSIIDPARKGIVSSHGLFCSFRFQENLARPGELKACPLR